ncbi:MAG: radical SAM protein [Desulfobacteraceae bacterium]|nr:radical SAM protein [Desulfobacteraceae bacterium]
MRDLKKSRFTVEIPVAADWEKDAEAYIAIYHTLTGALLLLEESDWSDLFKDSRDSLDQEFIDELKDEGFLVRKDVDEFDVFECWKQQQVHNFDTITAKVNVTRKCNNRCTYCILDYEAREMTPDTARKMDEFYIKFIKDHRPLFVKDDYLGGEPLLNTKVLLESAQRRFDHCQKNNIDYSFSITTNGMLLTPEIVSNMNTMGLSGVRVSLAGPARIHDQLRPLATGGKTYDTIIQNLKVISGMTPISIECQYDSGTTDYKYMPEMLDDFKNHEIAVDSIFFTPILKKRGDCQFNCGIGDPKIALDLMKQVRAHGFSTEREAPASLCRADFRAMLVFDTDGSIIPCPALQEGELAYGHVAKGIDFILESLLIKRKLPGKCMADCELLPICMGGCRQQALVYHEDFAGIDCRYESLRFFLDDYIKETALAKLKAE